MKITKLFFKKINQFDEKNIEYEYIDIIGEIKIDLLNIENKNIQQFSNYIDLILEMKKNESLNEKYHFSPKKKLLYLLQMVKWKIFLNISNLIIKEINLKLLKKLIMIIFLFMLKVGIIQSQFFKKRQNFNI